MTPRRGPWHAAIRALARRAPAAGALARLARRALVPAVAACAAGCVPTGHTIDEPHPAALAAWEAEAARMCRERTGVAPPTPFATDGCTLAPDGAWQACCVEHDMAYWCGGSREARRQADAVFRACIAARGGPAGLMHRTVRVTGHPWVPAWWRWGYGWPWPRGYRDDARP